MDINNLPPGPAKRDTLLKEIKRSSFERNYTKIIGSIYLRDDQLEDPLCSAEALLMRYPGAMLRGFAALAYRGYSLLDKNWVPALSISRDTPYVPPQFGKVLRNKQPKEFYIGDKKTVSDVQAIVDIFDMPDTWERQRGNDFAEKVALLDHLVRQNHLLFQQIAEDEQLRRYCEWIDAMADSRPESILRVRLRQEGITGFMTQVPVQGMRKTYYVDLGNPLLRVGLEYQGAGHFASAEERSADSHRQNDLRAGGWVIIEVTSSDLWKPQRWDLLVQRIKQQITAKQVARQQRLPPPAPLAQLRSA